MANHKPQLNSGWCKAGGFRVTLTHRYQPADRSWWLDTPREQWPDRIASEQARMAASRYGLLQVKEQEWEG